MLGWLRWTHAPGHRPAPGEYSQTFQGAPVRLSRGARLQWGGRTLVGTKAQNEGGHAQWSSTGCGVVSRWGRNVPGTKECDSLDPNPSFPRLHQVLSLSRLARLNISSHDYESSFRGLLVAPQPKSCLLTVARRALPRPASSPVRSAPITRPPHSPAFLLPEHRAYAPGRRGRGGGFLHFLCLAHSHPGPPASWLLVAHHFSTPVSLFRKISPGSLSKQLPPPSPPWCFLSVALICI